MAPAINDMPVKRVYVDAAVRFEAYVLDHGDDTDHEVESTLAVRIAHEIADAVEHHAPHLSDSEDTDALVALVGGGSGRAADVIVGYRVVDNHDDTDADVQDAVEGTQAWKG